MFKLIFIALFTFGLAIYLFPLNKVDIGTEVPLRYCLNQFEIGPLSTRGMLADAIQAPLNLKLYDVTVKNTGRLKEGYAWDTEFLGSTDNAFQLFLHTESGKYSNIEFPRAFPYNPDSLYSTFILPINEQGSFTFDAEEVRGSDEPDTSCFVFRGAQIIAARWVGRGPEPEFPFPTEFNQDFEVFARPNLKAWLAKVLILFVFSVLFVPPFIDYVLYPLMHSFRWLLKTLGSSALRRIFRGLGW
ncbi:MAG: hypothetical protein Q7R94_01290 [bacterium]|nr:hypothetical protein [bacterium]